MERGSLDAADAVAICMGGDLHVAFLAPSCSPLVSEDVVVFALPCAVADK